MAFSLAISQAGEAILCINEGHVQADAEGRVMQVRDYEFDLHCWFNSFDTLIIFLKPLAI